MLLERSCWVEAVDDGWAPLLAVGTILLLVLVIGKVNGGDIVVRLLVGRKVVGD